MGASVPLSGGDSVLVGCNHSNIYIAVHRLKHCLQCAIYTNISNRVITGCDPDIITVDGIFAPYKRNLFVKISNRQYASTVRVIELYQK